MDPQWPSFDDVTKAYRSCRLGKRASSHQTRFEASLGRNLFELHRDLHSGKYKPLPVVCFVVTRPKPREIFAAHFRDRIVHHLVVSRLTQSWEKKFIHSSFACRKGKGTHGALKYFQRSVRSISQGGLRPAYALQLDLASFFVTIHRPTLCSILTRDLKDTFFRQLIETLYLHDARPSAIRKCSLSLFDLIPREKSWFSQSPDQGLPIGNLISQFGANVYLTELDHLIQRKLKPQAYLRYMDDLTLLDSDPEKLKPMDAIIHNWLQTNRHQSLNPAKSKLTCLTEGIEYLGYQCKQMDSPKEPLQLFMNPDKKWAWIRELKTFNHDESDLIEKVHPLSIGIPTTELNDSLSRINSRLGYLRHARSFRLRKKSLDRLIHEKTENGDVPVELADPWCPWKIKRDYTAFGRR